MPVLKIEPEFQSLVPALSPDERAALEDSLKAEGCRDALVVWAGQGVLLDGHNRYAICQEHGIDFRVEEIPLASRDHAIVWIVRNQIGRRNVSQFAKDELVINALKPALVRIGLNRMKEASSNEVVKGVSQCDIPLEDDLLRHKTDEELAKEADTSETGIRQSAYISKNAPESVKKAARSQDISRRRAYEITRAIQELPAEDRARAAEVCIDHDEKARILKRLHKSQDDPDSNGTYEEILRTGGFHYGDDLEQWCDFAKADVEAINKALGSLAKHHAQIGGQANHQLINQSDNNEWYTPPQYIASVHDVLGEVDVDPASNELANQVIKAKAIYTIDNDGFDKAWRGKVFLNPPYGRDDDSSASNQARWSARLIEQFRAGTVTEAILLVNAVPGNKWFAPLWDFPLCFVDHRIRFYNRDVEAGQPTHSNAFIYMGSNVDAFARAFSKHGIIAVKYEVQQEVKALAA